MTRNGAIAGRFAQAVRGRLVPNTGVTLKMLARQTGLSHDTMERYLADSTTIPASAVQACDAAFRHFKLPPGFLQEVMGGGGSVPGRSAGADLCFVATHDGTLHSAPMGHGAAVRQYVGLPAQSRADAIGLGLEQLGWIFLARRPEGRVRIDLAEAVLAPRAAYRALDWLDRAEPETRVEFGETGTVLSLADARQRLAGLAEQRRAEEGGSGWTSTEARPEQLLPDAMSGLWREFHQQAVQRIPLLDLAARTGVTDRAALFLVEAGDAINAHLGAAMRVSPEVVGRSIHARRDQGYAGMVLGDLEAAAREPDQLHLHRITRAAGGHYTRLSLARRIDPSRAQVMTVALQIEAPADLVIR